MPKSEKQLEHKFARFEMKDVDFESSEFTGYSSGIGNKDLGGDIIEPGSFSKTIQERVPTGYIKLLDNHNDRSTRNVWGTVKEAREIPWEGKGDNAPSHKLFTRFSVSKADPDAQIALRKIAEGHLDQLSIGYRPLKVEYEKSDETDIEDPRMAWIMGQGVRRIKEIQWWETSVVIWGMNPEATIIQNSITRLTDFAQKATQHGVHVPEDEVKNAILALNNMIGKDASDVQRKAIAQALDGVSEAVDNVCSLAGKNKVDPIRALVDDYRSEHGEWDDESFSIWVNDQVKGLPSEDDEVKGCGCESEEETPEEEEKDCGCGDKAVEKEEETPVEEETVEEKEADDENFEQKLVSVLGKLSDELAAFKTAVSGAESPESEEESTPDAEVEESEEKSEDHTEDDNEEEAAKDADEEGRSKHFPGQEELAAELERVQLMALEFDMDN